jgi:hypothetical protein
LAFVKVLSNHSFLGMKEASARLFLISMTYLTPSLLAVLSVFQTVSN